MTDQQRAEVLQQRDKLPAQLNYVTARRPGDDDEAEALKTQIEVCNLELSARRPGSSTYNPPNEDPKSD